MSASILEHLRAALADRYRIQRELGRGGMGTVFLAEDLKHHRRVAIKVLEPGLAAALGRERFLREIETVARLSHPHILPLHDSGEADGLLYYVMPYVEGESLQVRLSREKQLPLEDALKIAREVADALAYAHGHGVVHRDIKPGNILLQGGHAVVADFGLARVIASAVDPAAPTGAGTLTAAGSALGTPAYMSPEQAAGSKDVDGRSDLYSLGCVLYEMLTGQPPFTVQPRDAVRRGVGAWGAGGQSRGGAGRVEAPDAAMVGVGRDGRGRRGPGDGRMVPSSRGS
jgi:serine/threonine protein kinase